jgi:hypothetical protein
MLGIIDQNGIVMQDLSELIERASKIAGSDNKLAKLIEAPQTHISQWKNGNRPCPPADVALMASIAGLDADEWLVRAVMAKHEGTPKGEKLMRVLKASLLTGGVVGSGSALAATTGAAFGNLTELLAQFARCILC